MLLSLYIDLIYLQQAVEWDENPNFDLSIYLQW